MKTKCWFYFYFFNLLALVFMTGCNSEKDLPDLAPNVDLERFMGTWYVHGYTSTALDREAHNATESYELDEKGRILTTYQFRKGSFDGKQKTYKPVGKVVNTETNSEWKMRFFSIISASYLILYVDSDYQYTLVGHPNRKMAWLMSRSPEIEDRKYLELIKLLKDRDFDLSAFDRVPQKWDA